MFRIRFAGDVAELGIIRGGALMKVQAVLNPRVHLVCNEKLRCVVNFSTIFFICGFHWLDAD